MLAYNRQLVSYRQTAEWGMRTIRGAFDLRQRLLENTSRLTNIQARRVGISQIRTVYLGVWQESEDQCMWTDLGNMLFGNIRQRDHVSRFHLVVADPNTD
jgi:hypothetical protein